MKLISSCIILILSTLLATSKNPQEVYLKSVWGEVVQSKTETYIDCKKRAINEAKVNALRIAGIPDRVTSYTTYFQSEVNGEYTDIFKSEILNDINGYVIVNKEIEEKKEVNEFGNIIIKVNLDVTVLKYETNRDITFNAWIDGLEQKGYMSTDKVKFTLKPNQNMYVHIFDLVNEQVYPLYPNPLEPNQHFIKDSIYNFPTAKELDYQFEFEGKRESHNFVFVFTKEDIPYTNSSTKASDLMNWIFRIPPHQRMIKTYSFEVFKNY